MSVVYITTTWVGCDYRIEEITKSEVYCANEIDFDAEVEGNELIKQLAEHGWLTVTDCELPEYGEHYCPCCAKKYFAKLQCNNYSTDAGKVKSDGYREYESQTEATKISYKY